MPKKPLKKNQTEATPPVLALPNFEIYLNLNVMEVELG